MSEPELPLPLLSVKTANGLNLDVTSARECGEILAQRYASALPYPHIAIDTFLPTELVEEILELFPNAPASSDLRFEKGYAGLHKRTVRPYEANARAQEIFNFFNSAPFLSFLEALTGIDSLIGDPYFEGGGFHETSVGGRLGIHTDFRVHERLHLQRRINLLLYLNKDWQEEYGGNLELWDSKMTAMVQSIAPIFNRCVVFTTDENSFHGHPDPLSCPLDRTRKSIALYYYTASRTIYEEIPSRSTMYRARPGDDRASRYQAFRARSLSYAKDILPPLLYRRLSAARGGRRKESAH